jgi:hypothetical protein
VQQFPPAQNIAEGKGGQYKKEFIQFLHIAQGSLYKAVTLNEIFRREGLLSEKEANEVREQCEQIDRELNGLINSLRGTDERPTDLKPRNEDILPPTKNEANSDVFSIFCLNPSEALLQPLTDRGVP